MKGRIVVVYGGSGSGKSQVAENISEKLYQQGKKEHLYYIATMIPYGEESKQKIERHKRQRQEKDFVVKEIYYDLRQKKEFENSVILLDCLSNLIANEWYRFLSNKEVLGQGELEKAKREICQKIVNELLEIREQNCDIIVVTNDIFRSVRTHWEGEEDYLSCLGLINEKLVKWSDCVYQVVAGQEVCLKSQSKKNKELLQEIQSVNDNIALSLPSNKNSLLTQEKILVVGGEFQGKKEWAKHHWLISNEINISNISNISNNHNVGNEMEKCGYDLYFYVDQWIHCKLEENPFFLFEHIEIEQKLKTLWELFETDIQVEENSIFLMNEIGCGIVPLEKKDRIYRELSGRFMCQLAEKVDQVYQIIAGREIRLK